MQLAMSKLAVVTLLALVSITTRAHADGSTTAACDQDPRCYARELAHTLTTSPDAAPAATVELPHLIEFEPGRVRVYSKSREKLMAIVEKWKLRSSRAQITVRGYAAGSAELGQRRADKIRGYLIRYGVPAELVVAVGQAGGATVDLSIALR